MSTFLQSVDRAIGALISRLFLAITLLELAIVMFAATTIYQDRTIFEERAIIYSENLVQMLSRDLNSSFARIDLMLLAIKDEAERLQSVGGNVTADIRAFADRQMNRQLDVSGIVVTNKFGAVIYRYGSSNQPEPNYADRDYFGKLKSGPGLELVISKPLVGKRIAEWQIVFARRVNGPGDTFAGVVFATVPLELFQKQFSALKLGPKSAINLRDADLATVTRYPDTIPTSTGNPTVSKEWREKLQENPEFGSYFAVGLDNLGRAISFRKIGQFSHYVIVGLYPPDFLEPWTSQAKHTIVLATVAMMLVALLGVGARRLANAWFELRSAEKDIKRMNAELDRKVGERTAQLEAANKELDAFAYSASHDLRAPLQTIDGFSRALLEDYGAKVDAEARDYLERIRAASQRMAQLVDDLLRLSRITRADMAHESVDLSELARSIADELRTREPARNVAVDIAAGEIVQGDRRLLRVLLENLFSNAWKFTSKLPRARIEFTAAESNGERVYCVRDDGAGFDMAYAGKLFTPFLRLHAASEFPGNGVGLATVQRIAQRHGGRAWAEGAPGKGAAFYFTIAGAPAGAQKST